MNEVIEIENERDIEIAELYSELGVIILRNEVIVEEWASIFTKTCKENYSNILKCQKYKTNGQTVIYTNPPEIFCNAFYNYIENKKGKGGRLTIEELKQLLVETSTLDLKIAFVNEEIQTEKNFTNLLRMYTEEPTYLGYETFGLENFTETPSIQTSGIQDYGASATIFVEELRRYNLRRYGEYFKIDSTIYNDIDEINNEKKIPIASKVVLELKSAFLSGESVSFYYIGDEVDLKRVGYKIFLNKNINKITKYREKLLEIKRVSPQIDKLLANQYDNKTDIKAEYIENYYIFEKYYIRYRELLNVLGLNDKYLYVTGNAIYTDGNPIEIGELINDYNNIMVQYNEKIDYLTTAGINGSMFSFRVLNFETPYSTPGNISEESKSQINSKEICDFKPYTKKIKY